MYELNIGQNNGTKKLETDKIIEITNRYYIGATITTSGIIGLFEGEVEKSAIVQVISDEETLFKYMRELRKEFFYGSKKRV